MRNFSIRLTAEQYKRLTLLCEETNQSKSDFIRNAVEKELLPPTEAATRGIGHGRQAELIEYLFSSMDHIIRARYGEDVRAQILDQVSDNLGQFYA